MIHTEYSWKSYDNINLFAQSWVPKSDIKLVICIVHGIGEHSSRYGSWAKKFTDKNIAVISYDKRGQGLSDGDKGKFPSYDALMKDTDLMLDKAGVLFPNIPRILYGHSMGGGEVIYHAINKNTGNYKAVIATSPWLIAQKSPSKPIMKLVRWAYNLFPDFTATTGFNADNISQSDDAKEKYLNDKLIHHTLSLRLFVESYDAGYSSLLGAHKINKPILLMHGDADKITSHKASVDFSEKAGSICTLKLWTGGYHELHNEPFNDKVFEYIINWIDNNIL